MILLVVYALAVARVTRLLTTDRIMVAYRRAVLTRSGPDGLATYLAHCDWCTSVWVAALLMPVVMWAPYRLALALLLIPAASQVAALLNGARG